eukprot:752211-Hanusia_phi.AAC.2
MANLQWNSAYVDPAPPTRHSDYPPCFRRASNSPPHPTKIKFNLSSPGWGLENARIGVQGRVGGWGVAFSSGTIQTLVYWRGGGGRSWVLKSVISWGKPWRRLRAEEEREDGEILLRGRTNLRE